MTWGGERGLSFIPDSARVTSSRHVTWIWRSSAPIVSATLPAQKTSVVAVGIETQ